MLYGLFLNFNLVCCFSFPRVARVKQFQLLVDPLFSPKSSGCVFPTRFLRYSSNFRGCKEIMAASGSVVPSADFVVDSLMSSCGNLSGFMKSGLYFNGKSNKICRKGRVSMRNGKGKSLYFSHGCLLSNRWSFDDAASTFSLGMINTRMCSFSCNSDRVSSSEASADTSFSMEQISSLALSVQQKEQSHSSALKLVSGACCLPHPSKVKTGGEDAYFICHDEQAIGVADGVGGWADVGVDAGEYARSLMYNSAQAIREAASSDDIDLLRVLEKAHSSTNTMGSSTACIVSLIHQDIHAINLGDSGFIIIRNGQTVFQSPVQQHGFNFPYQLERNKMGDLPSSGQVFKIPVVEGDVIVAGSDGLFDNLYSREIETVVGEAMKEGLSPEATAEKIAGSARERALDTKSETPFSAAAQQAGFSYYGGKLDDLTVVVSYVSSDT